jgi:hypothetical protein
MGTIVTLDDGREEPHDGVVAQVGRYVAYFDAAFGIGCVRVRLNETGEGSGIQGIPTTRLGIHLFWRHPSEEIHLKHQMAVRLGMGLDLKRAAA